jgi:hypothetical protein
VKLPLNLRTKKIQTLGTTFIFNILNQSLTVGFRPPPNTKKATVRGQEVNLRPSPRNDAIYRPFSNPQPPRSESNTSLKLPLLLIPQSQTEPLTHHEITLGLDTSSKIARLLGCSLTDSVVLHSEDQIAYVCFFLPPKLKRTLTSIYSGEKQAQRCWDWEFPHILRSLDG